MNILFFVNVYKKFNFPNAYAYICKCIIFKDELQQAI